MKKICSASLKSMALTLLASSLMFPLVVRSADPPTAVPGWQQALDRGEIENLLAAAVFAYDRQDGAGFAKYFTSDGVLITVATKLHPDAGVTYKGPERLNDFVTKNQRGRAEFGASTSSPSAANASSNAAPTSGGAPRGNGVTHHIVSSNYIRLLDATHAKHWGYWMTSSGGVAGVYDDDIVKVGGRWLLSSRKILYTPLNPDAQ